MRQAMALADTRNKTWAEDKSKFGYKMLQKMGWSEGKGLGVKEDGTTEHIRVRRKTSGAGVGGAAKSDVWSKPAQVAEGLNSVLARLAPVNCDSAVLKAEKATRKGRGYHQRRSAGKNVSGYSESELREILGGINVERGVKENMQDSGDGEGEQLGNESRVPDIDDNAGNSEPNHGSRKGDHIDSKRKYDEEGQKRMRKERRKKVTAIGPAVEAPIKKSKKSKKSKKRQRR